MLRTLALILAGGASPQLSVLTAERTEAAMAFAGKFRIIDFPLSNCVNSGIYNVGILTQYRSRTLYAHLGVGKPWDLDRAQGGLRMLHPSPSRDGASSWQRGTADALRDQIDFIEDQPVDYVLLLAGDHIYKMDYRPLIHQHVETQADITIAAHIVNPLEMHRYGIVSMDATRRITSFVEKPRAGGSNAIGDLARGLPLASMGIYVFSRQMLVNTLKNTTATDIGRDLLPRLVSTTNTYAYHFQGYWADVGNVQAYYEANMSLLADAPTLDLYDPSWVVHTVSSQEPAVEVGETARVENSLLSDGSRVYGQVVRSVISPGVFIGPGAVVRDSIILNGVWIGAGATVNNAIVDEDVRIGNEATIGDGEDGVPNEQSPDLLNTGLTVVGTRAQIPPQAKIGHNAVVRPRATPATFGTERTIPSGGTIG